MPGMGRNGGCHPSALGLTRGPAYRPMVLERGFVRHVGRLGWHHQVGACGHVPQTGRIQLREAFEHAVGLPLRGDAGSDGLGLDCNARIAWPTAVGLARG